MNIMKKMFALLVSISMLIVCGCGSAVAVNTDSTADDFSITVSETDDNGEIEVVTYTLEDLSCTVYDIDGNEIYSGPAVVENLLARFTIKADTVKSGSTTYWYPTKDKEGFESGNGIAVTVSIKTNSKASKTIGLTDGDSSGRSTNKNLSAILYTGTSGHWKFYVTNHSSSDFKVTGGKLSWEI
ncbi:MAG: hypothetical protein LUD84_09980 [Clostridiales bacterium]|nr:hypothetical protein [Clostridiales bacterium]